MFSFEGTGNAPLAQLVEQLTLNQWALGSSPRWRTTSGQAPYPSHPAKAECSVATLPLLSSRNPRCWACGWGAALQLYCFCFAPILGTPCRSSPLDFRRKWFPAWPVGQVVKTEASHAFNIGSNPVRVTKFFSKTVDILRSSVYNSRRFERAALRRRISSSDCFSPREK